jgi:hypothetical protein
MDAHGNIKCYWSEEEKSLKDILHFWECLIVLHNLFFSFKKAFKSNNEECSARDIALRNFHNVPTIQEINVCLFRKKQQ